MLDHSPSDIRADAAQLNARFRTATPQQVLDFALHHLGTAALVSSFGAESAVLLHMTARIAPATPVLLLETGMLFAETLAYQQDLTRRFGLSDVRLVRPLPGSVSARDAQGDLHKRDTDACCALRKVEPLRNALLPFETMISGRKRYQSGVRETLERFEIGPDGRLRVNPLAHWGRDALRAYAAHHDLPSHPLVAEGFASIGCIPCTSAVAANEPARAGRWRGQDKVECGIHIIDGRIVPATEAAMPDELPDLLVRDDGFHPLDGAPVALDPAAPSETLRAHMDAPLLSIDFPAMTDGRGFTLARQLREMGYAGRLRATGALIADQYAMARRVGFDEVQISAAMAARQPEVQWLARADWRENDHRARLAG